MTRRRKTMRTTFTEVTALRWAVLTIALLTAAPATILAGEPLTEYDPEMDFEPSTIYILPDGSIDPPDAPVSQDGDVYTLTDDVYESIVIQKSEITLDCDGHTVQGTGGGRGIFMKSLTGVTVTDCTVQDFMVGIRMEGSTDGTFTGNTLQDIGRAGFAVLVGSNGNTLAGNTATDCRWGIVVTRGSAGNTVSDNNISYCSAQGILLQDAGDDNYLVGNSLANNVQAGIWNYRTSHTVLMGNEMVGNGLLLLAPDELEHWNTHTIDTSNTTNGKPVIYWKNVSGGEVPAGAGQVILANTVGVKVENQKIRDATLAITMGFCDDTKIEGNVLRDNGNSNVYVLRSTGTVVKENRISGTGSGWGIELHHTSGSLVKENVISNIRRGIPVYGLDATGNVIEKNLVEGCEIGISLEEECSGNLFRKNTLSGNETGATTTEDTYDNVLHHNDLLDNDTQADEAGANIWDDGQGEGNYWSDYEGEDLDDDGVGDTDLPHASVDWYPLMEPVDD
jgi:parallel beta-helix repeat protein